MSMSIPLVWPEVIWQRAWGPYLGRELAGHAIVDGGLLSNFPLELFVSSAPRVQELMGPRRDTSVLGLLVDEELAVPGAAPRSPAALDPGQLRLVRRLTALVETAITAHDKMVLDEHGHLVVRLPAKGYGTTEFDLSDARRDALVAAGAAAMAAHLDRPRTPAFRAAAADGGARADRLAARLLGIEGAPERER
jgi:predicted acylesterase/phospholipase RssA